MVFIRAVRTAQFKEDTKAMKGTERMTPPDRTA
jgi:hypothetical protein